MLPPIPVARAEGALLYDENGNSYIDAISSWWVNIHAHPYIAEKIYEQAKKLEHVIFTGFTHEPAVSLAERLLQILPGSFSKIFYSDNGSTAVEAAIKMAIQYWRNNRAANDQRSVARKKILAFKNSYHGDTFGAMSISNRSIFTEPFYDFLFEPIFIDTPTVENISGLFKVIEENDESIAAFVYEPLLQAAGGMLMYSAALLDQLLTKIKSRNIICIADEVMTGFGRTGKLFACDYLINKPDIICLSKGLTGGTMALGATAASQNIFEAFASEDKMKTFFHGHSFTANPIACAAALASLNLLEQNNCMDMIGKITEQNKIFVQTLFANNSRLKIKNIRQTGTIIAFEIQSGTDGYLNNVSNLITQQALQHGIYLRPLGNTVYIMPPYCISDLQLNRIYQFLLGLIIQNSGDY